MTRSAACGVVSTTAQKELNQVIEDETRDTVVLAFANTLTSSTTTRSNKEVIDGGKNERIFGGVLMAHVATLLSPETGVTPGQSGMDWQRL